jgi:hypothetical protein
MVGGCIYVICKVAVNWTNVTRDTYISSFEEASLFIHLHHNYIEDEFLLGRAI